MSRRTFASLVASGLLIALLVAGALLPVPFVMVSPGPTVDVLGESEGRPVVRVEGARTYPTEGQLRLTTVSVTRRDADVTLLDALGGWLEDDVNVMPFEVMYPDDDTAEQDRTESVAQMVGSQDTAVAAALSALGYDLDPYAEVLAVYPGQPADGELRSRDRIVEVDGAPTGSVRQVIAALEDVEPGDEVTVTVERGGDERRTRLRTVASDTEPERAVVGIQIGTGYDFPVQVEVGIDDAIGGPSAGLVFALSVYDTLTPGSLTGGTVVAGTGTITAGGQVGPIGGIRQKIAGAADAGAELFLVPRANCADLGGEPVAGGDSMRLVRADTFEQALASLEAYGEDPAAELPQCPELAGSAA